jgi:hypothetical protein
MQLFTVKNNETGVIKGLSQEPALDLIYFDAIQAYIDYVGGFTNDEIKAVLGGYDMGYYVEFLNELDQLSEPMTVGRYTVTPIA